MRRKVIQDFANVFCQHVLQVPNGYDLASFVYYGSGKYELNILTGESYRNGELIPKLGTCDDYKKWLQVQLDKHRIPRENILVANLEINVAISQIKARKSYGHEFVSALFSFDCSSEIRTDEAAYLSNASGEKTWGFDWMYNKLYGSVLKLADGKIIRIKRDSGYADRLRAYKVFLDGDVVGEIYNGQLFELKVIQGKHRLQLKIDWASSNIVDFEMNDRDLEFQCGSNLRGFKILLAIFYGTIFPNQCIWLKAES
jgi:hypothetical protein